MQEKSKILILSTGYLPLIGGSELAIKNITDRLPDFHFDLITGRLDISGRLDRNLPEQEVIGNISVHRVGNPFSTSSFFLPRTFLPWSIFLKARQLTGKNKYKLIHAYQASQAAGAGWLLKFFYPGIPFVVTLQEGKDLKSQGRIFNFFRNIILRKADRFTVISTYLKDYLLSLGLKVPISIVPNGVDPKIFRKLSATSVRGKLNIDEKDTVAITVSRLVPKNGSDLLIKALSEVNLSRDLKLIIVGKGPDEEKLRKLTTEEKLSDKVFFTGEIAHEDLPEYLSAADIFVRPSRSEGLGNALLEAMAVGLPVIGTPVGGITDFLIDGETGFYWKVSEGTLAEKISGVLNNRPLMEQVAVSGQNLVKSKYNWDNIADSFRKFYLNQ